MLKMGHRTAKTANPKEEKRAKKRPGLVLQLWGMMMGMVLLAVVFMWAIQFFLIGFNYTEAALSDFQKRLEPAINDLAGRDLAEEEYLLPFLSRLAGGTLYLADGEGNLTALYSYGHVLSMDSDEPERHVWEEVRAADEFQAVLDGIPCQYVQKAREGAASVWIGTPVTYAGTASYLLIQSDIDMGTALDLSRKQFILLTFLLFVSASVLAAVCTRLFTKPIFAIQATVDRLAANDFAAETDLRRNDEFGDLARSVGILGQKLARLDVLRREVIANVSHELRSPLSVISGYAELVRDVHWKDDTAREEDLNLIIEESNRMSEMVNDILDYSQFQSGYIKLRPELFDLAALARSETGHGSAAAASYGIQVVFQTEAEPAFITADPLKLSQVIRNLLNNAINHTQENEVITVSLAASEGGYRLSVANPGAPIPEEDREIIWERYQRSQHQSGRRMGTGIGLSIVSTVLNAHHMPYGLDCRDGLNIFWFTCEAEGETA